VDESIKKIESGLLKNWESDAEDLTDDELKPEPRVMDATIKESVSEYLGTPGAPKEQYDYDDTMKPEQCKLLLT
jgi:hypothetical protein